LFLLFGGEMKAIISTFLIFITMSLAMAEQRATATSYVDLSTGYYIPATNCEIYYYKEDFNKCQSIQTFARGKAHWGNGGYALNCVDDLRNTDIRNMCIELSNFIANDADTLRCDNSRLGVSLELDRCFIVKDAYDKGYFDQTQQDDCYDCSVEEEPIVVRPQPIEIQVHEYRESCYDRAYNAWREESERRREEGAAKTIIGTGLGVLGQIIAGVSDNDAGRAAGNIVTGVGVGLAAYGMFEMASASFTPPHMMNQCRDFYYTETRPVVIERQRCTTTRYYSNSWGRTHEYFETRCSTKTYYSFERNSHFWM
jgi:hypothetical protein